jgi:hypothetical protein
VDPLAALGEYPIARSVGMYEVNQGARLQVVIRPLHVGDEAAVGRPGELRSLRTVAPHDPTPIGSVGVFDVKPGALLKRYLTTVGRPRDAEVEAGGNPTYARAVGIDHPEALIVSGRELVSIGRPGGYVDREVAGVAKNVRSPLPSAFTVTSRLSPSSSIQNAIRPSGVPSESADAHAPPAAATSKTVRKAIARVSRGYLCPSSCRASRSARPRPACRRHERRGSDVESRDTGTPVGRGPASTSSRRNLATPPC